LKHALGLCLTLLCSSAVAQPLTIHEHKANIKKVVEKFRKSIIQKDKATMNSLFFNEKAPFIAVFSDEMLTKKRLEKADYPAAVDFGKFGTPADMISDDADSEEKIWNVKVQTDGYLASVYFDYSDHKNGKKKAFGTESWSLIRVEQDWKITSVAFTVTETEENK